MFPKAYPSGFRRATSAWISSGLLGLLVLLAIPAYGQDRAVLERQRKALIAEIGRTDELLKSTRQTRAAELDRFLTLKKQIAARRALVATVQAEIAAVDAGEARTLAVIALLREDAARLRAEYARMLRAGYRQRLQQGKWLFLFSAAGVNQAYRRWQYLRQYEQRRRRQARLIIDTEAVLAAKLETLAARRSDKEALLAEQEAQVARLAAERDTRNKLLVSLGKDERRLSSALRDQRQSREALNGTIETLIRDQMAAARRRATRPAAAAAAGIAPAPAAGSALSNDFRRSRGQLSWPVQNGLVIQAFGRQPHPTLPNIFVTNNGIDLRTDAGATVRAVFAGEVVSVQFVPGMHYMVLLRHGTYYTVYSNLATTSVAAGESITTRAPVGTVHTDPQTNSAVLHFELWEQKRKTNPADWLR